MKDTFTLNLGIKLFGKIYRIAYLNSRYKNINNTYCWNTGWKKLKGRFYTNIIDATRLTNK